MTQPKTRWSNPRDLEYEGQGVVREHDRRMPRPARVIRGSQYEVEEPSVDSFRSGTIPKAVALGRISLEKQTANLVRVEYEPARYGIGRVETLEEREARHQREFAELRAEGEAREKAAYEKGLTEGFDKGMAEGRQEVAQSVEQIGAFLQMLREGTTSYFQQVESRLAGFAMKIARKIVGDAASLDQKVAEHLAGEAIRQAIERTRVVLLVNPADFEMLESIKPNLLAISEGIKEIDIQVSQRVSPGSVILESAGGSIDATIETMLDEVHLALLPEITAKRDTRPESDIP